MIIKQITDPNFFTSSNFPEFVKSSIFETKYAEVGIVFDPTIISAEFISATEDANKVCLVCMDGDKMVGILLGEKTRIIFSKTPISEQRYVRIDENYRNKGIYSLLLAEFYKWSKLNNCVIMVAGSHVHTGDEKIRDIYKEKGFKPFHYNYYIEV